VLAVLGFHAFPDWVKGGFVGVDVFFVISGFLISTIIFENLEKNSFTFAGFYARRVNRIFPALFVVLVSILVIGWFAFLPDEYKQLGKHTSGGAGFISNILLWKESGYFDVSAETKPLLHLWSLGIEEQFYIVWPFILWFGWKRRFNLLWLTLAIATISFALNIWFVHNNITVAYYSPLTRFWELLIGACLAYLTLFNPQVLKSQVIKSANLKSFVGIGLIIAGLTIITQNEKFPGWWALLPTLGAALIIAGGPTAWVNRNILSNRLLVAIGLISYPLYLWHWPLFSILRLFEGTDPARTHRVAAALLSILLAWLTFQFVEKSVRSKPRESMTLVLVGAMFCVGCVGFIFFKESGIASRFGKDAALLSSESYFNGKTAEEYLGDDSCFLVTSTYVDFEKNGCENSVFPDRPKVFLIGDSHMTFLSLGLRKFLKAEKYNVYQFSAAHCTPLSLEDKRERCRDINKHILGKIEKERPDYIVLFAYYMNVMSDTDYGESRSYDDFLYEKTIEFDRAGIKDVFLIGPMPVWGEALPQVLGRQFVLKGKSPPLRTYVGLEKRSLDWDTKLRSKDYPANVTFISLKDFLCDESGCLTSVTEGNEKSLLVFDYGHLTIPGAEFVTQKLISPLFNTPRALRSKDKRVHDDSLAAEGKHVF